jgi:sulfate adenylyltransferase subunit 1 (EFTu-like GTPase family)
LCWLDNQAQRPGTKYIIRHGSADARAMISQVDGVLDILALEFQAPEGPLSTNSISQVQLKTTKPLVMDAYRQNRITGSFILVDETSGVDVYQGKREVGGSKGFSGQMAHHNRVFAPRKEDARIFELRIDLANDVHRFGLQFIEMVVNHECKNARMV